MIPIYERTMARSVMIGADEILKVIHTKEFEKFITDLYDDKYEASVDLAVAINSFCFSAIARPIVCDVYKKGKLIDDWFVEINNKIYNIRKQEYYDGVELRKSEKHDLHLSPSVCYNELVKYLKTEAYKDALNINYF